MEDANFEWISPSTFAKRLGISTQMVYVRIKEGIYEARQYERGSMNGWLVKAPRCADGTEDGTVGKYR